MGGAPVKSLRNLLLIAAIAAPAFAGAQTTVYTYTQSNDTGNNQALGFPVPGPVFSQTPVAGFRLYSTMHARAQDLMATQAIVNGTQTGTSLAGRQIWSYTVSSPGSNTLVTGTPKPAAMMTGGIHAREWGPPEIVLSMMERLVDNRGDKSFHQYIVENMNIVLTPVLNVDGFLQTQRFPNQYSASSKDGSAIGGRQRRKNMRSADEVLTTMGDNALGVDVNRNHVNGFGGGSSSPSSETYRGASIASEPESQALYMAAALGPELKLRYYADIHSFSKVYITPMTGNTRRDALTGTVVARMRAAVGNVGPSNTSYAYQPGDPWIGATDEYFAGTYLIPSVTIEIEPSNSASEYGGQSVAQSGFILPESEITRVRDDIARGQLFGFYHQMGAPTIQSMQIVEQGTGTVVQSFEWQTTSATTRALSHLIDSPLETGKTYNLWLSFTKPMRYRNGSNVIANYPGQSISLSPTITITGLGDGGTPVNISVPTSTSSWKDLPGGAPTGFLNYKDDSLVATFTVSGALPITTPASMTLNVTTTDMAGLALDGRPETVIDWVGGSWTNWENAAGTAGDVGGTDSRISFNITAPSSDVGDWQVQ